ncbi:MAG TPA: YihY/virulence factor BrkB family protein [Planctomycetaceae bacterium]|nr:YihY/virulence factor BrkB family protein [Planctomycetaceae bacterium]
MTGRLGERLWGGLKAAAWNWSKNDGAMMSAALAYYASLSLFPACLLLIAGLGWLSHASAEFQGQQQQLLDMVERNASPWLAVQLKAMMTGIKTQAIIAGPLATLSLIVAAISVFVQLDNSFERIWGGPANKSRGIRAALQTALHDRIQAFLVLVGIGSLVFVVFFVNLLLSGIRPFVSQWFEGKVLWNFLQIATTVALNWALFTALYKTLPKAAVGWGHAASGGLLAAVVWQIGQRLLEAFVISDHYTAYGVLGSFMAVMLWMYYGSAVLLLGAEFVRAAQAGNDQPG